MTVSLCTVGIGVWHLQCNIGFMCAGGQEYCQVCTHKYTSSDYTYGSESAFHNPGQMVQIIEVYIYMSNLFVRLCNSIPIVKKII